MDRPVWEQTAASQWFSVYFGQQIMVRYAREGFPDDALASGPTIISTGTLRAVGQWFPDMTFAEARWRFRSTLEIGGDHSQATPEGLPAFWEDQLFAENERNVVRSASAKSPSKAPIRAPAA